MTGVDTSSLVALAVVRHPQHAITSRLVAQEGRAGLAVAPLVLSEFVHCVTDPRRFENPLSMTEALAYTERFLDSKEVHLLVPSPSSLRLWLRWMGEFGLGRKRTLDTQLAATLHTAGVRRLLTGNPADFRIFGVFDLLAPGTEAGAQIE